MPRKIPEKIYTYQNKQYTKEEFITELNSAIVQLEEMNLTQSGELHLQGLISLKQRILEEDEDER